MRPSIEGNMQNMVEVKMFTFQALKDTELRAAKYTIDWMALNQKQISYFASDGSVYDTFRLILGCRKSGDLLSIGLNILLTTFITGEWHVVCSCIL